MVTIRKPGPETTVGISVTYHPGDAPGKIPFDLYNQYLRMHGMSMSSTPEWEMLSSGAQDVWNTAARSAGVLARKAP
jgi:hypothetical protein